MIFLRALTFFSCEEISDDVIRNQEDLIFRWLTSRRDYPYYHCAPPESEPKIFDRCVREFQRSNPGFELP